MKTQHLTDSPASARTLTRRGFVGAGALAASLLAGCGSAAAPGGGAAGADDAGDAAGSTQVAGLERPSLFSYATLTPEEEPAVPTAQVVSIESGLANVIMSENLYLTDEQRATLERLGFCADSSRTSGEFHQLYESNRYGQIANYVTVDSLMHTYHLYFQYLLKNLERTTLRESLRTLSTLMAETTAGQLDALTGSAFEQAAQRNLAFFSVGTRLLDEAAGIDGRVEAQVQEELSRIQQAAGTATCAITEKSLDYSQFIVRGYYLGDPLLESYFRAMMWYGQVSFFQNDEELDRSALLMTLALNSESLEHWKALYLVTSFFAGASDDNTYYEYRPAIDEAYGPGATVDTLIDDTEGWARFHELTAQMPTPEINSLPGSSAKDTESDRGLRFMGQRFSIDAQVFQRLVHDYVGANAQGQNRLLPNALDVPAAFGSGEALTILKQEGETSFDGYTQNMQQMQEQIAQKDDTFWHASLYNQWLRTLQPLLREAPEGSPSFTQSTEWTRRKLEAFLGSYTELKHDTVLYSKQAGAEGDGAFPQEIDDRGFVDPEPFVFLRLANLCTATAQGLSEFGIISDEDESDLDILKSLALQLATIATKELKAELPTDEEFELIRSIGVQLQHFWEKVHQEESEALGSSYVSVWDFPAPVVVDVANGDGQCLELGCGKARAMYVVVPVEGTLRVASGPCFDFHQFAWPASDRLTDQAWRDMLNSAWSNPVEQVLPEPWTSGYVVARS